jgi:hypothetical protein
MTPAASGSVGRGSALLLEHVAAAGRLTEARRATAEERLAAELGADCAWRLVRALSGERPLRAPVPWTPALVVA